MSGPRGIPLHGDQRGASTYVTSSTPLRASAVSPHATTNSCTSRLTRARGRVIAWACNGGRRHEWQTAESVDRLRELNLHHSSCNPPALGPLPTDVSRRKATSGGERIALAEIDGKFLSAEVTESFTGRVIGLYAVSGTVAFRDWVAEGDDE